MRRDPALDSGIGRGYNNLIELRKTRAFEMIYEILSELGSTTSRNEKIAILERNRDNELLQDVLLCALDPFINYFQKIIPAYKKAESPTLSLDEAIVELDRLAQRTLTGDAARSFLANLLSQLSEEDADVLKRIVRKDPRCGVQASTVNSVWGGLIPTYPVMLCREMDRKLLRSMIFPAIVQVKMDGMRVNAHVQPDGSVELRSRTGKEINLFNRFQGAFPGAGTAYVIDGELLVLNEKRTDYEPRKIGNGILNKAVRGTISEEEAARVVMVAWDYITNDEFRGVSETHVPYKERLAQLKSVIPATPKEPVRVVDTFIAQNLNEVEILFRTMLEHGEEGVIVKSMDGVWVDGRPRYQVKMKAELECDLVVTGWDAGTGKFEGSLGSLLCESDDGKVIVSVGTGFDDETRQNIWANRDAILGKIVAVKYNARISSKDRTHNGVDSLFLPVFVEVRVDKTVADSQSKIK